MQNVSTESINTILRFTMNTIKFKEIIDNMLDTYEKKNADYGDSFSKSCDEFGSIAALVRMTDKMNRIKQLLLTNKQEVNTESVKDTLLDLANYSVMLLIWLDDEDNKSQLAHIFEAKKIMDESHKFRSAVPIKDSQSTI